MARGKLTEAMLEAQYKPGQSGHLKGRTKKTPEQKKINAEIRNLTSDSFNQILHEIIFDTVPGLKKLMAKAGTNVLTVAIGMCLLTAIKKGDWNTVEKILERLIGKTPNHLKIVSNITNTLICKIDPEKLREAMAKLEADV